MTLAAQVTRGRLAGKAADPPPHLDSGAADKLVPWPAGPFSTPESRSSNRSLLAAGLTSGAFAVFCMSSPMFGISNAVAYELLMVNAKREQPSPIGEFLGPSRWIDVRGIAEEKWCPEEGRQVLEMLRKLAAPGRSHWEPDAPDLYIVTPFVVVAERLRKLVEESAFLVWTDDPRDWTFERIGTVHTVQGREAEAVIFILGAPAPGQAGARAWAGSKPNLLNVAVSRAKERLYVVGNRELWRQAGLFSELDDRLPPSSVAEDDVDRAE